MIGRPSGTDRRGFTLVEMIVVVVLGSMIVMATYQVLLTNQRTYTAQGARIQGQQLVRGGTDVLFSELREISVAGGDLLSIGTDQIEVRVMRSFGVTCDLNTANPPRLTVRRVGRWFEEGDSVFVFADNDTDLIGDDTWIRVVVSSRDTFPTCPNGTRAQHLNFSGFGTTFTDDSVRVGAPLRSYTRYTYGLFVFDGEPYLGRSAPGEDPVPLVGPIDRDGVRFSYFDETGSTTTDPSAVSEIELTLHTTSPVRGPTGQPVADSLTTRIYPRN